jgi:precorrin-8X/cobalt-precorrin-8 methylmutase
MTRQIHPIEVESYRILRSRIDLSHLPPLSRAVTERVVHAAADLSFVGSLVLDEAVLKHGRNALLNGAPVFCDARMAAAGITSRRPTVPLDDPRAAALARSEGLTRSAAAMRIAASEAPAGAIWVVGNAPTALAELIARRPADPALIVGLPVGFVGAAEAKASLVASGLPAIANVGERGGSAVAVAAVNALLYFDPEDAR